MIPHCLLFNLPLHAMGPPAATLADQAEACIQWLHSFVASNCRQSQVLLEQRLM